MKDFSLYLCYSTVDLNVIFANTMCFGSIITYFFVMHSCGDFDFGNHDYQLSCGISSPKRWI